MDFCEKQILDLADNLTEKETGNIRSVIGIMNIIYGMTEEICRRNRKVLKKDNLLTEAFKKELSVRVVKGVVDILYDKDLIDYHLNKAILDHINVKNLDMFLEFFEDISEIWNNDLLRDCLCRRTNRKKALRKLKI